MYALVIVFVTVEEDSVLIRPAILLAACAFACTSFASICSADSSALSSSPALSQPADSEASQAAPDAAPKRFYHHRTHGSRHSSASRSLPSRGIVSPSEPAASVVGRLALVTSDKAVIVAGREAAGRVLSVCPKGQYLALSGQTPTQYAVLMVDHSTGFVAKSDVQLLDYQVVSNAPDAASDGSVGSPTPARRPQGHALVNTPHHSKGVH